ncbi:hypothetical protein CYMTET_29680 [Cymbomonas tetramitiformis]|uniref:Uncharacterized protein n=1 Tax=Cymbomonas tetramitiformis TaxID=36881 RepID=A0AAE0FKA3_9CHLO|nr:hypothetical protein CYMTET_29680 [Cymbomonas tetramitiformis]
MYSSSRPSSTGVVTKTFVSLKSQTLMALLLMISKSSEGLTLKEEVQLGFLGSSDLAAVVDELSPFDAVRHVEDYLATINLKSFNNEGV